jgi:ABC-type thiamine transport system ATPase subunit
VQLETVGNVLLDEAFSGLDQRERDGLLDLLVRIRGNLSDRGLRVGELVDTES